VLTTFVELLSSCNAISRCPESAFSEVAPRDARAVFDEGIGEADAFNQISGVFGSIIIHYYYCYYSFRNLSI